MVTPVDHGSEAGVTIWRTGPLLPPAGNQSGGRLERNDIKAEAVIALPAVGLNRIDNVKPLGDFANGIAESKGDCVEIRPLLAYLEA